MSFFRRLALKKKLTHEDPAVRQEALDELGEIGSRGDVETIAVCLKDEKGNVRKAAAQALKKIGDPRAIELLATGLADEKMPGPGWQTEIVVALESFNDPRAIEPLVNSLGHGQPKVRRAAAAALGKLKNPTAIEPLANALKDTDPDVAREVGDALAKFGNDAVPHLMRVLKNEKGYPKNVAAEALGIIGNPDAIPLLAEALSDKDSYLQITVAKALARFNDPRVIDPLIEALDESSTAAFFYGVREEAEMSLIKMGAAAVQPLIDALQKRPGQSRVFVAKMLGQIPDPRSFEPLLQLLKDTNGDVRKAAIYSLAAVGKRKAIDPILPSMDDSDAPTRRVAAETLTKLGWQPSSDQAQAKHMIALGKYADAMAIGDVGVESLLPFLHDADDSVRRAVSRVVVRVATPRVLDSMAAAAKAESNFEIQKNIIEAMEVAGSPAIPTLTSLLESGNWTVAKLAGKSLAALKWQPETPKQGLLQALATGNADAAVDAAEAHPEILADAMRSNDKSIQSTAATVRLTLENMRALKDMSRGVSSPSEGRGTAIVGNAIQVPNNSRGRALQKLFLHIAMQFSEGTFSMTDLPPVEEEFMAEIRLLIQKIKLSGGQVPASETKMAQSDLIVEMLQLGLLTSVGDSETFCVTEKGKSAEIVLQ